MLLEALILRCKVQMLLGALGLRCSECRRSRSQNLTTVVVSVDQVKSPSRVNDWEIGTMGTTRIGLME